jgi:diguanylate cyclase (GGDEF)-like protein
VTCSKLLRRAGVAVLLTATLAYTCALVLHPLHGYDVWRDAWLANLALTLPGLACLAHAALDRSRRLAALGLGLGMLSFALGNIAYVCLIRSQVEPPVPSLADVGYLGFYPLAGIGALLLMRRARKLDATLWLDGLLGAVGAATAVAALLNPIIAGLASGTTSEALVAGAYPVGDVLVMAMLAASLATRGTRDGGTLVWLGVGLLCFCAADVIYAQRIARDSYVIGTPLDALWSIGMTIMTLALWRRPRPAEAERGSIAVLAVPLVSTAIAVAVLLWATGEPLQPFTLGLAVVTLALAAIRTAVAFHQLHRLADARRQARTDDLTGLCNRRGLQELAAERLTGRDGALLLVDLDGFKEINDVLGHEAGDVVLREVGRRLAHTDAVVARLGGDEFAILLGPGERPEKVARRLLSRIGEPLEAGGISMRIEASIGIAAYPEHGSGLAALLRHADIAMYEAKRRHSGAERYASEYDRHTRDRLQIRQDLDRAFERGEFVLHYQPICRARDGVAVSVEALVRWQHPERGLLFPDAFLGLIEQRGQTSRLTETVLALAAVQSARWRAQGIVLPIAVNLTATDLLDASLPARLRRLLEGHDLPLTALELEITESLVLTDPESATRTLARLRALGVKIAVDDYGTGYSSLSHLRDLPVDHLKIDRSFVTDVLRSERTAAIVRSTVELAHALGLRVVAEGVEDRPTLDALRALGCDWVQGYLFTKPLPPASLAAWQRAAGFVADLAGGGDQYVEGERDRAAVQGSLTVQDS